MADQNQTDSSFSGQLKQGTFVTGESIQQFQEELREAEKERLQSGKKRKEMMDDLRQSFHTKDASSAIQENKIEHERIIAEGSITDLENITKTLHRDVQTLQAKHGIAKSTMTLFQSFQSTLRSLLEKKKLYETIENNVRKSLSNQENVVPTNGVDQNKLPAILDALSHDIEKMSTTLLSVYQKLDEEMYTGMESEAFAQELFYSCMVLVPDNSRQKILRLCKTKCHNASIEHRTAVYRKLLEQLASKEKRIAQLIHQKVRAKAKEYDQNSYVKLAIKELCFAVSLYKDDALSYRMLYKLFTKIGDTQKAFTSLRQILQLNPDDNKLRKKVALHWYKQGNVTNAIEVYKLLVEQPGVEIEIWKELGKFYFENHNFSDVPSALQPYLEKYPQDTEAKKWSAISFMNCELYSNAIKYFEELLEDQPGDTEILKHLVFLYRIINQHQNAVNLLRSHMEYSSQNTVLQLLLGAVYQENGDWEQAETVYDSLLQTGVQSSSVLLAAAQVKQAFNKQDKAILYLEQAVEIDPNRWDVWLEIGKFYRNQIVWDKAEDAFSKANELSSNNPSIAQERMLLYSMSGDWEQAAKMTNEMKTNNQNIAK